MRQGSTGHLPSMRGAARAFEGEYEAERTRRGRFKSGRVVFNAFLHIPEFVGQCRILRLWYFEKIHREISRSFIAIWRFTRKIKFYWIRCREQVTLGIFQKHKDPVWDDHLFRILVILAWNSTIFLILMEWNYPYKTAGTFKDSQNS